MSDKQHYPVCCPHGSDPGDCETCERELHEFNLELDAEECAHLRSLPAPDA